MEKLKACLSYIIGGLMSLIVIGGLFISTKGYNTDEVVDFDPSRPQSQARKVYHSIGNGFTSMSFKDGAGMIAQTILQVLLIIGALLLICLAVVQTLKAFNVIKEDAVVKNSVAKALLGWVSLAMLALSLGVLIAYWASSKELHFSLGLGTPFNLVVIILCIFGRKILENKLKIKL